jgi:hypothetical protein
MVHTRPTEDLPVSSDLRRCPLHAASPQQAAPLRRQQLHPPTTAHQPSQLPRRREAARLQPKAPGSSIPLQPPQAPRYVVTFNQPPST